MTNLTSKKVLKIAAIMGFAGGIFYLIMAGACAVFGDNKQISDLLAGSGTELFVLQLLATGLFSISEGFVFLRATKDKTFAKLAPLFACASLIISAADKIFAMQKNGSHNMISLVVNMVIGAVILAAAVKNNARSKEAQA